MTFTAWGIQLILSHVSDRDVCDYMRYLRDKGATREELRALMAVLLGARVRKESARLSGMTGVEKIKPSAN